MKYTIELEYGGNPYSGWTATVHFPDGGAVIYGHIVPNDLPHTALNAAAEEIARHMGQAKKVDPK